MFADANFFSSRKVYHRTFLPPSRIVASNGERAKLNPLIKYELAAKCTRLRCELVLAQHQNSRVELVRSFCFSHWLPGWTKTKGQKRSIGL